jgi:hypothetical protein
MKALAAIMFASFLVGCSKDADDRAFFGTGWVKPEEGATRRMFGDREKAAIEKPAPPDAR